MAQMGSGGLGWQQQCNGQGQEMTKTAVQTLAAEDLGPRKSPSRIKEFKVFPGQNPNFVFTLLY